MLITHIYVLYVYKLCDILCKTVARKAWARRFSNLTIANVLIKFGYFPFSDKLIQTLFYLLGVQYNKNRIIFVSTVFPKRKSHCVL